MKAVQRANYLREAIRVTQDNIASADRTGLQKMIIEIKPFRVLATIMC